MIDTSLLPLLVTMARPRRGIVATPMGVVPTLSGALEVPVNRFTKEMSSEPEFATTATSKSVSIATPTGEVPTATGWITENEAAFETDRSGFCTSTTKRRADASMLAGIVATSSRQTGAAGHAVGTVEVASGVASKSTTAPGRNPSPITSSEIGVDGGKVFVARF